jgi:DNA-binding transcriptional LysR family regulator
VPVELRELTTLVAVVDHGTLVRAARALHQAPSTVSHTISTLESRLGVQLFTRSSRGMVLTSAGDAMLGPARRALREAAAAQMAATRVAATAGEGGLTGPLAIVSVRMKTVWLADLLASFRCEHPTVMIRLRLPEREEHVPDLVRTGEFELGVMRLGSIPPDLTATVVGTSTSVMLVPADHELATRSSVTVGDLDGVAFIAHTSPSGLDFRDMLRAAGASPRVVVEASDTGMAFELVRAGIGVAIVAHENVATVIDRGTVAIPFVPERRTTVAVVSRRDGELGAAATAFLGRAVDLYAA